MPLVKALYGHPQAGVFWERRMHQGLISVGFASVGSCGEWRSVYHHDEYRVLMIVYVDDFKLAGAPKGVDACWKLIRGSTITEEDGHVAPAIVLGPTEQVGHFLGCAHHPYYDVNTAKGGNANVMVYEMHKLTRSCVERYEECAARHTPGYVTLR